MDARQERAEALTRRLRTAMGSVTKECWAGESFVMDAIERGGRAAIEATWCTADPYGRIRSHAISAVGGTHGQHTRDDDCTIDAEHGIFCVVCNVMHGWPCAFCGGTGYHTQECADMEH